MKSTTTQARIHSRTSKQGRLALVVGTRTFNVLGTLLLVSGIAVVTACSAGESVDLSPRESQTPEAASAPSTSPSDELAAPTQPEATEDTAAFSTCQELDETLNEWDEVRDIVEVLGDLRNRSEEAADAAQEGRFKPAVRTIKQYQTVGADLSLSPPQVSAGFDGTFNDLVENCPDNPSRQRGLWAQQVLSEVEQLGDFFSNDEMYEFPYNPGPGVPRIRAYFLAILLEAERNGTTSEVRLTDADTLPEDFKNIAQAIQSAEKKGQSVVNE